MAEQALDDANVGPGFQQVCREAVTQEMRRDAFREAIRDGRLVVDEPTTLPEGTVVDLVVDDEGDDLDEVERATLHAHLEAPWKAANGGELVPAADVLAELRRRS